MKNKSKPQPSPELLNYARLPEANKVMIDLIFCAREAASDMFTAHLLFERCGAESDTGPYAASVLDGAREQAMRQLKYKAHHLAHYLAEYDKHFTPSGHRRAA